MEQITNKRIAITGAFGFIGANVIKYLNQLGYFDIDAYETHNWQKKWQNTIGLKYNEFVYTDINRLLRISDLYDVIIHLSANSSTKAEANEENWKTNYLDTISLIQNLSPNTRLIFASSASTFGMEENDFTERVEGLNPICFYAYTKWKCDEFILKSNKPNVYGLKFFNVYGSALERYKGGMSSVIYRWLTQDIREDSPIELFKSLRPEYKDGHQARDFVTVWDICSIIHHCMITENKGGLFNAGSGSPKTWLKVAGIVLDVRGLNKDWIKFVDMPLSLKDQYQYFTCSNNTRLREELGYKKNFLSLEEGIHRTWDEINSK